jgi:hypothetical protein
MVKSFLKKTSARAACAGRQIGLSKDSANRPGQQQNVGF